MNLNGTAELDTITVYQDDPVWSKHERWFQVPRADLQRLYVGTYEIHGDCVQVEDVRRHAVEVAALHPGCILIHI